MMARRQVELTRARAAGTSPRCTRGAGSVEERTRLCEAVDAGERQQRQRVLVECDGSRILIDCGFGTRTLAGRLKTISVAPESIDACLITHEHTDHVKGAKSAMKRWGWGIFATPARRARAELAGAELHRFTAGHDARLSAHDGESDADAARCARVGWIRRDEPLDRRARRRVLRLRPRQPRDRAACESLDILVLESNHDDDMLRNGPYPPWLQARIASRIGHLSNRDAAAFAREAVTRETEPSRARPPE